MNRFFDEPLLNEAYEHAARNLTEALNPDIFFGYFSVCSDRVGHGHNTTFPGLDWGQSAEALLWLGRSPEVLASWDYVRSFQREDGLLPFAILPDAAGTVGGSSGYPMPIADNGGVYKHWVPHDPFRTLANVTFLQMADAIYRHTTDDAWLREQMPYLQRAADHLLTLVTPAGLVGGAGFYLERPVRFEYDGVTQCMTRHAFQLLASLCRAVGEEPFAQKLDEAAARISACFQKQFWTNRQCVEYIHPQRGAIAHHGLTDTDWAAIATGILTTEQEDILWPQLKDNADFLYDGMPTGIATRPETYEDWEMQSIDSHDLAAMGRVWYLEAWARHRMSDTEGLFASLKRVAQVGRDHNWNWHERYYSDRTGNLSRYHIDYYCEYPANLIRITHRFIVPSTWSG